MAATEFTLNHPLAVKRWSDKLSYEAIREQYFNRFMGTERDSMLVVQNDLSKGRGEQITVGLRMKMTLPGVEGLTDLTNNANGEESLTFFNDSFFIDQQQKGTEFYLGISEQRVPYEMRLESNNALRDWWAEEWDEQWFIYLSGARGVATTGFHNPTNYTGRANNPLVAIDAAHLSYGGNATGKADVDSTDIVSLMAIEKLYAKADLLNPKVMPFKMGGKKKYVFLMHTIQAYQLRSSNTDNDWLDIHKNTDQGPGALMYTDALGEYSDVILHKHHMVIQFSDYGAGGAVPAARGLLLGAQAGICGNGMKGGIGILTWYEEKTRRGNSVAIASSSIYGLKRSIFNSKTFGLIGFDAACPLTL